MQNCNCFSPFHRAKIYRVPRFLPSDRHTRPIDRTKFRPRPSKDAIDPACVPLLHRTYSYLWLVSRVQKVSGTGYPIWQVRKQNSSFDRDVVSSLIFAAIPSRRKVVDRPVKQRNSNGLRVFSARWKQPRDVPRDLESPHMLREAPSSQSDRSDSPRDSRNPVIPVA